MADNTEKELSEVLQVRRNKLKELVENGKDPYTITKYDVTDNSKEIFDSYVDGTEMNVSIAGRLMSKRVMGKASFAHIRDSKGLSNFTLPATILALTSMPRSNRWISAILSA